MSSGGGTASGEEKACGTGQDRGEGNPLRGGRRRAVIIGGAPVADYARVRGFLRPDDFCIYCDSGLNHMEGLRAAPDLVIGDFDSHVNPHLPAETIVLPRAKDDTDTFYAAKEAAGRGFEEFLLIGVIGGRLDHTLANLSVLLWLYQRGKRAWAVDDYSEMEIVGSGPAYIPDRYPYFSLLCVDGPASGITVRNAKFPLEDGEITPGYQYGVSNEALPGMTAQVSVREGCLLLVKDRV